MATIDALFSFGGSRSLGYSWIEAAVCAAFIFVIQYSVGVAIASRVNIARKMNDTFFDEDGPWGVLLFICGFLFIFMIVGVYCYDIYTNFAQLADGAGAALRQSGPMKTLEMMWLNAASTFWAATISIGDELVNIVADFLAEDEVTVTGEFLRNNADLPHVAYQQAKMKASIKAAKKKGKQEGANEYQ
ncbi:MAG: hypothetical protein ACO3YZ_04720 [Candidatus Nanopelagicaceae bacterium]